MNSTSQRPTLPSLRSLDLPYYEPTEPIRRCRRTSVRPLHVPSIRRASVSSSCTSASRTPSPQPNDIPNNPPRLAKFRLIECSLEEADAFVLVPPPPSSTAQKGESLLVLGKHVQYFRQNPRLTRGASLHPYKMTSAAGRRTVPSVILTTQ